jgi:hypothetical protein
MWRTALATAAAVAIVFASAPTDARPPIQAGRSSFIAYDGFMKMSPDERRTRFASLNAENKAAIVRTHAERWLAGNRRRLSKTEVAVFEEMIKFITPDRYAKRGEASVDKAEQALRDRMRCSVNVADVTAAFNIFDAAKPSAGPRWTYLDQAKCWVQWIAEDLIDYIPSVPR